MRARHAPARNRVLDAIRAEPGVTPSAVCRRLDLSWGSVMHHVKSLTASQDVRTVRTGRNRMLFATSVETNAVAGLAALQLSRARQIYDEVRSAPGIRQKELCDRLGMTRKVFRYNVNRLAAAGLVQELRINRGRIYTAGLPAQAVPLADAVASTPPVSADPAAPQPEKGQTF